MSKEILFSGKALPFGGLTNQDELVKLCPKEFRQNNAWSNYANELFFDGGCIKNWKWKERDEQIKTIQFECFYELLRGDQLAHQDKEAVAGWMLSEMLEEVPAHILLIIQKN